MMSVEVSCYSPRWTVARLADKPHRRIYPHHGNCVKGERLHGEKERGKHFLLEKKNEKSSFLTKGGSWEAQMIREVREGYREKNEDGTQTEKK